MKSRIIPTIPALTPTPYKVPMSVALSRATAGNSMLARTARHGIVRNMSQSAGIYQFESRLLMARRVSPNGPAQARRADDFRLPTPALTRRCLKPHGWTRNHFSSRRPGVLLFGRALGFGESGIRTISFFGSPASPQPTATVLPGGGRGGGLCGFVSGIGLCSSSLMHLQILPNNMCGTNSLVERQS